MWHVRTCMRVYVRKIDYLVKSALETKLHKMCVLAGRRAGACVRMMHYNLAKRELDHLDIVRTQRKAQSVPEFCILCKEPISDFLAIKPTNAEGSFSGMEKKAKSNYGRTDLM